MIQTAKRLTFQAVGSLIGIAIAIAAFCAFLVRSYDADAQIAMDGLGRVLTEPPIWARMLLTNEPVWAGTGWHLLDIVWFFGGLAIVGWLFANADE